MVVLPAIEEKKAVIQLVSSPDSRCCLGIYMFNLPPAIQEEIKSMDTVKSVGPCELVGLKDGNDMCNCEGEWKGGKFLVRSYGSHNWHWDGATLTKAIKEYV
jgi:hypothetical protein